jgi:hypothetical protein
MKYLAACFASMFMGLCGWIEERMGKWYRDNVFDALKVMWNTIFVQKH